MEVEELKHHATVQTVRERYTSRREKSLRNCQGFHHDGRCTIHARFEPRRDISTPLWDWVWEVHSAKHAQTYSISYAFRLFMHNVHLTLDLNTNQGYI